MKSDLSRIAVALERIAAAIERTPSRGVARSNVGGADPIIAVLERSEAGSMKMRDMHRSLHKRFKASHDLREAIRELEASGKVTTLERHAPGGLSVEVFLKNDK